MVQGYAALPNEYLKCDGRLKKCDEFINSQFIRIFGVINRRN